jgi:hypothetical protein
MDSGLRLRFLYTVSRNARGEGMLRPQIPLTLAHRSGSLETIGLLDTGADVNVMPYDLGVSLGADWDAQDTIVELSGNLARFEARGLVIHATVGSFESVRLVFAWTRATYVPLLLGQVNFFAEFDVCFYRAQNAFEVRPRDSQIAKT